MPLRPVTPHNSGSTTPNLGDMVSVSSYVPSGMIKSSFSNVAHVIESAPIGIIATPRTALPFLLFRVRWMLAILLEFVSVINPEQRSRASRYLAEADQ